MPVRCYTGLARRRNCWHWRRRAPDPVTPGERLRSPCPRRGAAPGSGAARTGADMRCTRRSRPTGCTLTADGQAIPDLRHRWTDGTTQLLFEPVELLERLAALTRRPRINLLLYNGVLGARSAWRSRLRAREPDTPIAAGRAPTAVESSSHHAAAIPPHKNWLWAELMQRSLASTSSRARAGGSARAYRAHRRPKGDPTHPQPPRSPYEVPAARPARPPPFPIGRSDPWYDEDVSGPDASHRTELRDGAPTTARSGMVRPRHEFFTLPFDRRVQAAR
jgi:hypothetical protein